MPTSEHKLETRWTSYEDEILKVAVEKYGTRSTWQQISECLPGRTNKSCRKRWIHSLDPSLHKGRWSAAEDTKLIKAVHQHGSQWWKIAKQVPGRTDDQCAKRWREKLDPSITKTPWSKEEDLILMGGFKVHGKKWNTIAGLLNGRPAVHCRNRCQSLLRAQHRRAAASSRSPSVSPPWDMNEVLAEIPATHTDAHTPAWASPLEGTITLGTLPSYDLSGTLSRQPSSSTFIPDLSTSAQFPDVFDHHTPSGWSSSSSQAPSPSPSLGSCYSVSSSPYAHPLPTLPPFSSPLPTPNTPPANTATLHPNSPWPELFNTSEPWSPEMAAIFQCSSSTQLGLPSGSTGWHEGSLGVHIPTNHRTSSSTFTHDPQPQTSFPISRSPSFTPDQLIAFSDLNMSSTSVVPSSIGQMSSTSWPWFEGSRSLPNAGKTTTSPGFSLPVPTNFTPFNVIESLGGGQLGDTSFGPIHSQFG